MKLALPRALAQIAAKPSTLRGMGWMLLSSVVVAIFNSIVRQISTTGLHPFEIAFVHSLFGVLFLSTTYLRHGFGLLKTRRLGLHTMRGTFNVTASLFMTSAVAITPLAKVAALSFSAPLFATVLALVLLGEVIRGRRMTALAVGFLGTWLVFRPGLVEVDLGSFLVLGFAACWGSTMIVMKSLARTESSLTMTLYVGLISTPLALIAALPFWVTPSWQQLAWLAALGAVGLARQLTLTQAFKEADATAILPLDFTRLIWMALIGYLAFSEVPDIWTWAGGLIIFSATTYITYREARHRAGRS